MRRIVWGEELGNDTGAKRDYDGLDCRCDEWSRHYGLVSTMEI